MKPEFQKLDFDDPPEDGLYWLLAEREEVDIDCEDGGRTVGRPTGGTERLVTLGFLNVNHQGDLELDIVDPANHPRCEVWEVSYFAPVVLPKPDISAAQ